jgi:thioredoxin-dependent peroxiredoxin
MRLFVSGRAATAALALALIAPIGAVAAQQVETGPKVGDVAPDFALGGATRFGILRDQIKLSDYKGNTVVLAFFFKARTKG